MEQWKSRTTKLTLDGWGSSMMMTKKNQSMVTQKGLINYYLVGCSSGGMGHAFADLRQPKFQNGQPKSNPNLALP